ncbi:MAG TPA: SAM-dependent chlorinase/fluorinase [Candidatus Acidoferrales bacterium]|nr:SAM-dependent chlorinase/fluorinase [Candidatus Acidoferrales bacterium]
MARPVITLTTDFGTGDSLVGSMKGVILNINPDAAIVDITHKVFPYDLLDGALAIGQAYKFFPPRTVHVVVVDPGVGTERRPLLVTAGQHYFIAPDNGVLSMIYQREESLTVRHITAEHYFLQPVSNTFHGRDIFSPVAAWLSKNDQSNSFGEEITDFVRFAMPKPKQTGNSIKGVILRADNFGNLLTNFTPEDAPQLLAGSNFKLRVGNAEISKFAQTFGNGGPNEPVLILGSSGFFEVAVNRGSAAKLTGASRGAEVTLEYA